MAVLSFCKEFDIGRKNEALLNELPVQIIEAGGRKWLRAHVQAASYTLTWS